MNHLTCDVKSCRHNADCLCDLSKIDVEGPGACNMDQTCCASFADKGSSAENSCGHTCGSASREISIDCKAQNCSFNENCKCTADNVNVGCCCSTPCVMSETECCTFQAQ